MVCILIYHDSSHTAYPWRHAIFSRRAHILYHALWEKPFNCSINYSAPVIFTGVFCF